jgi:protein tyrosine phosphatase (PTP) superfamily phosphohydrolase (DUF442 family)
MGLLIGLMSGRRISWKIGISVARGMFGSPGSSDGTPGNFHRSFELAPSVPTCIVQEKQIMSWFNWLQAGGSTRGKPRRDRFRRWRWPAMVFMAGFVLLQSGCQSGPFSHCGDGSGLLSPCGFLGRVSSRVFNRQNGACCGSEVVSGVPIESATPSIVTPGVVPSSPVPAGSTFKSYPSSGLPDSPSELNELPPVGAPKSKIQGPPSGGNGGGQAGTGAVRSGYQTRGPDSGARIARRRSDDQARTTISTPVPTSRSAQAQTRRSAAASTGSDDQDPFDHLPPLDLPGEVTRSGSSSAAPAAAPTRAPAAASATKADARRESPAPEIDELDLASATIPAPDPSPSASVGPGLARFVAVDLKLAGGSLPTAAGLNWLVEKGYRTVLDLRQSTEVPASFIAEVTNRGLRYVALPIGLDSIDRNHVDRFNYEIAAGEARPLFFFDTDGTRAGALWYIRRITADRVDRQVARREAEELGLSNQAYWSAIGKFVSSLTPAQTTSSSSDAQRSSHVTPVAASSTAAPQKPAQVASVPSESTTPADPQPRTPEAAPAVNSPAHAPVVPASGPEDPPVSQPPAVSEPPPAATAVPGDYLALRPFAAMVITGLSLPLAYWSRTVIPTILSKARASLPGGAPRPKSLPGELGA